MTIFTKELERYHRAASGLGGWLTDEQAALCDAFLSFQSNMAIDGHLLDIGVYDGRSASLAAIHAKHNEQLWLVDLSIPARVIQKLESCGMERQRIVDIECDSKSLQSQGEFNGLSGAFRWIHIDGEHTGEAVASDLQLAQRLVAPDGLVVVDDFFSAGYPQVSAATFQFLSLPDCNLEMVICGFTKAFLCTSQASGAYRKFIHHRLAHDLEERGLEAVIVKTNDRNDFNCFGIHPRDKDGVFLRGQDGFEDVRIDY